MFCPKHCLKIEEFTGFHFCTIIQRVTIFFTNFGVRGQDLSCSNNEISDFLLFDQKGCFSAKNSPKVCKYFCALRKSDEISSYQSVYKKWTLCEKCHDNAIRCRLQITLVTKHCESLKIGDGFQKSRCG